MAAPTAAELKARAEELDRREAALATLEDERNSAAITARVAELDDRDLALQARAAELKQRETDIAAAIRGRQHEDEAAEANALTYSALPDPQPDHGFIAVEAPLDLVRIYANLHPADRQAHAAQVAGHMRNALHESGKLRRGKIVAIDTGEHIDFAVLAVADTPGGPTGPADA